MSRLKNFSDINHSWSTEIPVGPGSINSLGVKTIKQIININTSFRDNYNRTSATDYIVKLPQTIKNVISMKLYDYHLPDDNYSICNYYHNNKFIVRKIGPPNTSYVIDVSDGSYISGSLDSIDLLEDSILNSINSHPDISGSLEVKINTTNFKTTFTNISGDDLELDFSYRAIEDEKDCVSTARIGNLAYKDHLTLGWKLGFRGNHIKLIDSSNNRICKLPSTKTSTAYLPCINTVYNNPDISFSFTLDASGSGNSSITSEGLLNLTGENHLFLSVNDFHNNHNTVYISAYKDSCFLNPNILGKLTDDKSYTTNSPPRIYFGPTDIDKLGITIYDSYGRVYNNNHGDYSIELLIESIYDGK